MLDGGRDQITTGLPSELLRNELVARTVQAAAAGSPFYARRFASVDLGSVKTVSDMAKLPVLTKDEARSASTSMLCRNQTPSHVQNTSGSTGRPLLIYRSAEEVDFIRTFFGDVHRPASPRPKPVVLALTIPHHGTATPIPSHCFVLSTAVTDDELLEQTTTLLETEFDLSDIERRASIIAGSFSQVLALTNAVLEAGRTDLSTHVKLIEMTGSYLTRRLRSVLCNTWHCRINDRYSLAEVFGGASHCSVCDGFHFDPHVLAELVDVQERHVVGDGVPGELVLTSLNPFVQYQPFIRYASGDAFKRRDVGCVAPTWDFLGRLTQCLFDPRRQKRLLISGRALHDAVDALACSYRSIHHRDLKGAGYKKAAGRTFFAGSTRTVGDLLEVQVTVEVEFTPELFPQESESLRLSIRDSILQDSPELGKDVNARVAALDVKLAPPGRLKRVQKSTRVWTTDD